MRTAQSAHVSTRIAVSRTKLTVKPKGNISSSADRPIVSLMKLSKHSAQKSSLSVRIGLQANRNKHIQLLSILLLLLLGETVLGLSDFEFTLTQESDETDSEIGSSEI